MNFSVKFKVLAPCYKGRSCKGYRNGELKWFYSDIDDLLITEDEVYIYCKYMAQYLPLRDVKVVCWWTGLKVDEKEIYEGDIVRVYNFINGLGDVEEYMGVVVFYKGAFCIEIKKAVNNPSELISNQVGDKLPLFDFEGMEVLSNIYDNPNLLKED